jgi:hypothetical protein
MSNRLKEIETQVDQLDAEDRIRLLQYLAPRIQAAPSPSNANDDRDQAWRQFRAVGARLAATSGPSSASITQAISEMRR